MLPSKDKGGWELASEGKTRFFAFVASIEDSALLKNASRLTPANSQAVAMAARGYIKVTRQLAEYLYGKGLPVSILGAADPPRKDPKTYEAATLGWEIACQLEESKRSGRPTRQRPIVFYVRAGRDPDPLTPAAP
jgi:hypothetical protein